MPSFDFPTTAFSFSEFVMRAPKGRVQHMNAELKPSVRCHPGNLDHHLWDNNGTWWCHLTVHFADFTKRRFRLSLETKDVLHARRLRDSLFALFGISQGS
jgi:hypothetical protein